MTSHLLLLALVQAPAEPRGFDAPPGYVAQRSGEIVALVPTPPSDERPCIYGVARDRPATGDLEADAESALEQSVVPGLRRLDDGHYAMRGTSADGWPYVWYRAAFEGQLGGQPQAVNAMAMVLPAGTGRVHVVWGMGSIARCLLDDVAFEQLFHSLRPAGWTSDGGKALLGGALGTWRFTASAGLQQITLDANGRYARDVGSRARVGVAERTSATATGGAFTLRDGVLALTPDHRPGSGETYRMRIYEEFSPGGWRRAMALLDTGADPPIVIPYYRFEENR